MFRVAVKILGFFAMYMLRFTVSSLQVHACAIHSISITVPFPGGTAWRHDRAGIGFGKTSIYTSFIAAKSFMSARYTLYLTTFSKDEPASSRTSFKFCKTVLCHVCVSPYSTMKFACSFEQTHRGLLDFSCCCLACTENETGNLDCRTCCVSTTASKVCLTTPFQENLQLCGLGGNFSLKMSSRDMIGDSSWKLW